MYEFAYESAYDSVYDLVQKVDCNQIEFEIYYFLSLFTNGCNGYMIINS
jgi:hypothetical protein